MALVIPTRAFNDKVVVGFLNKVLDEVNAIVRTLAGLQDVSFTSPMDGEVMEFNGTLWVNTARPATTVKTGFVKQAAASANAVGASTSAVSVTSADITGTADATYDTTEQDMLNDTKALANEIKADVNTLVGDLNTVVSEIDTLKDSVNDLKVKLRASGVLAA